MPPRILHLVDSLGIGGMERVLVSLANGLEERGWHQTVCCLRRAGPLGQALSDNVRLIEMGSDRRDWGLVNRLRRLGRQVGADLVHGQNFGTWCDAVRAFAGRIPVLQSFHGFLDAHTPLARRFLVRWLAGRTKRLLAVSEPLAREMDRRFGIHPDTVTIIPNGVDSARFAPRNRGPDEERIRASVGDRFLCVTVASLSPAKSPETLVEAARRLPDDVAFIWVGDGPLYEPTQESIERAELSHRFLLVGARSDVRPCLGAADLFVLPSQTEALPMCVLEAQSAGLPVVASRVGALPEAVLEGESGLLVEPADTEALAAGIKSLYDRPETRQRMGLRARDHVVTRFGIDRMIDRYVELYESVAAGVLEPAGVL